jgi:enoyl-CoA hydratase
VTVQIEIKDGVGTIRLAGPRANAMGPALIEELSSAIRTVGGEPAARAVVIASAHPKVFCPGLDLVTLSEFSRGDMAAFMMRFSTAMTDLFALKKPVIAAVNGAAVAGGCVLALTADWRLAKAGAVLGLNEVKVGVPLPWSVVLLLRAGSTSNAHSAVALLGRNFEGAAALSAGLAHEVADAEAFDATLAARVAEFTEKDAYAFSVTKGYLRATAIGLMREREEALLSEFLDGWFAETTQARIRKTVEALKAKGQ